jgi:hypothetical protein
MDSVHSQQDLVEFERMVRKFIRKWKGPTIAKTTLKKNKLGELMLPDLNTYCKVKIINTGWYWDKY